MRGWFELQQAAAERRAAVDPGFWTAPGLSPEAEGAVAAALAGDGRGGRAVHFGCGDGRLTARMAPWFDALEGLDPASSMVAAARARGLEARVWTPGLAGPAEGLDAVLVDPAWLAWPAAGVAEVLYGLAGWLRPGGRLRFPALWGAASEAGPWAATVEPRAHPPSDWARWCAAAGLVLAPTAWDGGAPGEVVWVEAVASGARGAPPPTASDPGGAGEDAALEAQLWLLAADDHAGRGAVGAAEACLEEACRLAPTERAGWIQWLLHRLEGGDLKGAALLAEAWSEALPEDAEAWLRRAELAEAREAPEEARAALARLRALGPVPEAWAETLAELEGALG